MAALHRNITTGSNSQQQSSNHSILAESVDDISKRDVPHDEHNTSLEVLLMDVLRSLGREDTWSETLRYLHTEWFHTEQDLLKALEDVSVWDALRLPARLKLSLKNVLLTNKCNRWRAMAKDNSIIATSAENGSPTGIIKSADLELALSLPSPPGPAQDVARGRELPPSSTSHDPTSASPAYAFANHFVGGIEDARNSAVMQSPIAKTIDVASSLGNEDEAWNTDGMPPANMMATPTSAVHAGTILDTESSSGWVRCYSPEHRTFYFYHEASQQSTWDAPMGVPLDSIALDSWSQQAVLAEAPTSPETSSRSIYASPILDSEAVPDTVHAVAVTVESEGETAVPLAMAVRARVRFQSDSSNSDAEYSAHADADEDAFFEEPESEPRSHNEDADDDYISDDDAFAAFLAAEAGHSQDARLALQMHSRRTVASAPPAAAMHASLPADSLTPKAESGQVDPVRLQLLLDMGFAENVASYALRVHPHDAGKAVMLCVFEQNMAQESAAVGRRGSSQHLDPGDTVCVAAGETDTGLATMRSDEIQAAERPAKDRKGLKGKLSFSRLFGK